jgi:regulator of replication initiation timing
VDTPTLIATIVGSILASSGLWAVIQTLINKKTGKEQDLKDIKDQLAELKQDNIEALEYRKARELLEEERLAAQKAERDAMIKAQRDLMRERLLDAYYRCTAKGYYSKEERETYGALFSRYESEPFNGNGVLHDLQPIMKELPWTKEE